MRPLLLLGLLVVAAVAAGCSTEDVAQAAARHAVQARVQALPGYTGVVRCTGNPRPWFREEQAAVFLCAARRAGGGCDLFRATRGRGGFTVSLEARASGCVLPQ